MPADFIQHQQRFTAWLRNPQEQPLPGDVPERRMQAYRELLTNNVESAISACFPVLRTLAGEERWQRWIKDFFSGHRCHSPIYRDIPAQFLDWLKRRMPAGDTGDLPFLLDLAHYEWMELALDIDPLEIPEHGVDAEGDLLEGVPVLNPLTRVLRYAWPVHRIGPDFRPAAADTEPTRLVMVRNRVHDIGFLEINPLVERLLQVLETNRSRTGQDLISLLAQEFPAIPAAAFLEGGAHALLELATRDIVLGTRREP